MRSWACAMVLALLALAGCQTGTGAPNDGQPPAQEFVVWQFSELGGLPPVLPFQAGARPVRGQALADPVYHTQVVRVSDKAADGYSSPGLENEYARFSPENADGTRVLLRGTDGVWFMYSWPGHENLGQVQIDNPDMEPRWDATDPNVFRYVEGPALREYRIDTGQGTVIHDFNEDNPQCAVVRSRYEGDSSTDARYWCFMLQDENWNTLAVVCYDRQGDAMVGRLDNPEAAIDNVSMSMNGQRCIVVWDTDPATPPSAFSRDFGTRIELPDAPGHADFALTADGHEVYVYQNIHTDWIAMADLETGAETNLVPIPFGDNPDIGLHMSGNCTAIPGWVLISTYGASTQARSWMDQSLFFVQLTVNPVIWRVAQTNCLQSPGDERDYFAEAFAAVNRAGTRVWWGSNWNVAGSPAFETYVAELPANWPQQVLAVP